MANFAIPCVPSFSQMVRMFEETDPANASLFNAVAQILVENDVYLKMQTERVDDGLSNLMEALYNAATDSDIDQIVQSKYSDDDEEVIPGFETASSDDIDQMIDGVYQEQETDDDNEIADFGEIGKLVDELFQ
jgi:hypothetical protein